ncbi:hypothetical protein TNCV_2796071 [Trichonephila clavipes]|nr:hypothetical protein TNCV_2796071 [Trichonephila clavipes]
MAPRNRRTWGKKYLLTIAIPDYRPSIENVELSSPVQHNASPDKNSRTTVMVPFLDVTAEIFPTVVRTVGLGAASISGQIGSITAPFVRELGKATHPAIPQVVFGVLAATGGCLVMLLPETNNRRVPDTLTEAAEISR